MDGSLDVSRLDVFFFVVLVLDLIVYQNSSSNRFPILDLSTGRSFPQSDQRISVYELYFLNPVDEAASEDLVLAFLLVERGLLDPPVFISPIWNLEGLHFRVHLFN